MPTTDIYDFPYEALTDQPGHSLHGGLTGTEPILAEEVEKQLARVEAETDSDIGDVQGDIAALQNLFATKGVQTIASIETGDGTNETEFVNIPQNFRHLGIIWYGQSDGAGEIDSLALRFNGDNGTNYTSRQTRNTGDDFFSEYGAFTVLRGGYVGTGRSTGIITIAGYSQSVASKYLTGSGYARGQSSGAANYNFQSGGYWTGTAAINAIRIWPSGQLWEGDPRITLIGYP